MKINVLEAFNPTVNDPDGARKVLIFLAVCIVAALLSILMIPALFLILYLPGYMLTAIRNRATGDNNGQLPDPLSLGVCWHGFVWMLVQIIYSIPAMGLAVIALLGSAGAIGKMMTSDSTAAVPGMLATLGVFGLSAMGVGLAIMCFVPMVAIQYSKAYQLGDCFKFNEILSGMLKSPVDYLMVIITPIAIVIALSLIPVAGTIISAPVSCLILANLAGQYGAQALDMHQGSSTGKEMPGTGFTAFKD